MTDGLDRLNWAGVIALLLAIFLVTGILDWIIDMIDRWTKRHRL